MTTLERKQISSISKDKKFIRFKDIPGDEYAVDHLDMTPFQNYDLVDVEFDKSRIISISFPPDLQPEQPSHEEINQKFVQEVREKKELQWQIVLINSQSVVLSKGDDDKKFNLTGNASKYHYNFKPGNLVKYILENETAIKSLWKVDEKGEKLHKAYNGQSGNVEKAAWVNASVNIAIASEVNGWDDKKTAEVLEKAIRMYNAVLPSIESEVKN